MHTRQLPGLEQIPLIKEQKPVNNVTEVHEIADTLEFLVLLLKDLELAMKETPFTQEERLYLAGLWESLTT